MKLFKNFLYQSKIKETYYLSSSNAFEEIKHKPIVSILDAILSKLLIFKSTNNDDVI
tara:strand:+ start:426 stop:596 length:171 start_codon:yes stop_codon:yes gene_type:complete